MDRAVSPVVAVVLLIAITVVGAAGVASVATSLTADAGETPTATLAVSAASETQRISLAHRGGDPLDFRNCSLAITVDGEPLAHQPPVPYFAAAGFRGTPTGPFNAAAEPVFEPGERAALMLASTNAPHLEAGDRVTVTIRRRGKRVATAAVIAS